MSSGGLGAIMLVIACLAIMGNAFHKKDTDYMEITGKILNKWDYIILASVIIIGIIGNLIIAILE